MKGSVSSGDLPAVCQSEAVLPQPLAHFPQQLPVKPQGQPSTYVMQSLLLVGVY